MKSFSVFVSSPGDLFDERAASYDILRRLQSEYAGRLAIEPIVWEHLPLGANAGFQEQLVSPGECDVVVCMLWGRLGTRLPAGFKKPDGSPYDSGTEYEFMQALEGAGREKAPVLLVYRKTAKLKLDLDDPQLSDKVEQRTKLETFFKKWFFNSDGTLARAFHQFEDPATFATRLEEHLRDILKHHLPAGSEDAVIEPTWEGSPYRGLDVFDYEHTRIFFGRSRAVNEVVDAMRRQAQERRAFVAVIGTSGSGKSSLLRAGVLPTLCEKHVVEGVEAWRRALVRPSASGGNLLLGLAEALLQPGALPELAAAHLDAPGLARLLAAPATGLHGAAFLELLRDALGVVAGEVAVAPALPKARLVLVLDQFEELFAMAELTDINRTDFISCISRLARSGMVWVLASLRSDFYPHCQSLPELVALKEGKGQYDLLPPGAGEIAQIIGLPTRMAGLRFEDAPLTGTGLADRLLEAAMKSPESLPLLEFALEELYKTRTDKGVLTLAAYKTMGGLEGALARRAEEVFASLALELQAAMPSVMRRLVRMEAGAKMSASGVRVPYDTVAAGPETRKFVDAFVTARLFVTTRSQDGTPLVGIAHEALLGNWPRLRNWLEANGEFLLWKMRLENALEEWGRLGQHPSLLLSGPALDEACRWLERFRDDLPEPSRKYIDQSRAAAEAAAREQQAAHDHELALIRAEAAAAGRLRRQARVLTGVCGLAITMAVLAVSYWGKARRVSQSLLAEKGEVIRQGQIALERDLTFRAADALRVGQAHAAIALATEAMRRSPDGARILRAEQVLRSCEERYGARALLGHEDFVESIAFSSDGKRVVTGSLDRTARIWEVEQPDPVPPPLRLGLDGPVTGVGFAASGNEVVAFGPTSGAHLCSLQPTNRIVRVDLRAKDAVLSASALSPDGKWLATSDGEKCIRLWAIPPAAPAPAALLLEGHTAPVLTLAFSADSRFLASGAADDCARVWDVGDLHSPPRVLTGHLDWVKKVVFGARAEHLYTASADGTARVWDLSPQPRPTRVLSNGGRSVRTVAASADGAWAVTLTEGDLEPSLWNLRAKASSEKPVRLLGFVLPPTGLAFSPDSRWLAVGGREHELRLYDMNSEEPGVADTVLTMQGAELTAMAFSPNGKWLATASHSPTATLWELSLAREAYHRRELRGIGEPLSSIEFGPRGRFVAALTRQGAALLWDMERRPQARATLVRQGVESIESLAFSSDGKWLATANSRSGTKLWDLEASSADRSPAVSGGALPSTAAIAFQPRGQLLACAQPDGSVRLFRKPGPQAAVLAATLPGHHGTVVALAMRPDGKLLATSGSDKSLRLWNLEAPETPPVELDCHSRVVTQLAFGTDGTRLLAGCSEGGAMLWEFRTDGGKPACVTMQAHALGVTAVYMTRDDKWAVTGGRSGDVRLWKLADLSLESLVLKKHSSEIDQIAGSPDGRMLVTIGQGDDPILWDLSLNDPGEHPSALGTQSFRATGVAFSDDGQHVVAASDKGFVRLWPATPKELLESAARNAVRNLTRREWEAALAPLPYERTFPNLPEPPDR